MNTMVYHKNHITLPISYVKNGFGRPQRTTFYYVFMPILFLFICDFVFPRPILLLKCKPLFIVWKKTCEKCMLPIPKMYLIVSYNVSKYISTLNITTARRIRWNFLLCQSQIIKQIKQKYSNTVNKQTNK